MPDVNSELNARIVKSSLDMIILAFLRRAPNVGAYELIAIIHDKLGIMVSPGVIYPVLDDLEKSGSLKIHWRKRKRIYEITEKGEQILSELVELYLESHKKILRELQMTQILREGK